MYCNNSHDIHPDERTLAINPMRLSAPYSTKGSIMSKTERCMKRIVLLLIVVVASAAGKAHAHGINLSVTSSSPFIMVNANFSANDPLVNASVTIFLPGEDEEVFQNGRTDLAGNFIFKPDRPGSWVYFIDDERGHRRRRVIEIEDSFFEDEPGEEIVLTEETGNPFLSIPPMIRVLLVFSILFGITGIYYGLKAGKSGENNK